MVLPFSEGHSLLGSLTWLQDTGWIVGMEKFEGRETIWEVLLQWSRHEVMRSGTVMAVKIERKLKDSITDCQSVNQSVEDSLNIITSQGNLS